ncbi:MAG: hypothetical protein ACOVQE_04595 [Chitinophagaceae bacterium]
MKNPVIRKPAQILLIIAALALFGVLFLPIWRIELNAPQYPEGLALQIHANDIKGDVDIINGLNHYIGMRTLHKEDFIEFTVLPYCIIFFAALFMLTAIIRKRLVLHVSTLLFIAFGIIAMIDFWRWEYNYGHNLDPNAAIKVPGMTYQPPLIGFKQLLNFGAYSIPDFGGWIFIGVGVLLLFIQWQEWRFIHLSNKNILAILLPLGLFFSGCSQKPAPIIPGKDQCHFCKMQLSEPKFAAVLLTTKGRTYKFDDKRCLDDFRKSGYLDNKQIKEVYYVNFTNAAEYLPESKAILLNHQALRSPMGGNTAAFASEAAKQQVSATLQKE